MAPILPRAIVLPEPCPPSIVIFSIIFSPCGKKRGKAEAFPQSLVAVVGSGRRMGDDGSDVVERLLAVVAQTLSDLDQNFLAVAFADALVE